MKIRAKTDGTILDALTAEFGSASRTRIRKMLQHEMVKVAGMLIRRADHPVKAGEAIEYAKIPGRDKRLRPPVPILFEDAHLLVVEKPVGLLTYGEKGTGGTSLYKQLMGYVRDTSSGRQGLWVVHRLDREVSGLVLFAKNTGAQERLKADWRNVEKNYLAVVEGGPQTDTGTIKSLLKEGPDQRVRSVVPPETGKTAITHYTVLRRFEGHALLDIRLETGRKNQIRVHLSEMGCPVVGDRRHGARDTVTRRIRLHACRIGFRHPVTGDRLEFHSPMPEGFLSLKNKPEQYKSANARALTGPKNRLQAGAFK